MQVPQLPASQENGGVHPGLDHHNAETHERAKKYEYMPPERRSRHHAGHGQDSSRIGTSSCLHFNAQVHVANLSAEVRDRNAASVASGANDGPPGSAVYSAPYMYLIVSLGAAELSISTSTVFRSGAR